MSFLKTLLIAAEIPEVTYIKFLHQYKFDKETFHIFLEGEEDKSFYVNYIEYLVPENYTKFYYICNGKKNVYQNHDDINWTKFNKHRAIFFTDKDFDDIIGINRKKDVNIFVTQFYSVENYLVNSFILERYLRELCNLKSEVHISSIIDTFDVELQQFSDNILSISAWLVYVRENNYPTNFNEINLDNLFYITENLKIKRKKLVNYSTVYDYLCKSTNTSHNFDFKEVLRIAKQLRKIKIPKQYIRGKYQLWFMFVFLKQIASSTLKKINDEIKEFNKSNQQKITRAVLHIEFKEQNIMQILAPRIPIPLDIKKFITDNVEKL